ncbi:hypothetical protein [Megalodesulfovibrio gigas]|uniref:Uncharacterized protein n=1 Tax=Megalodesulfovibrio gigas (strain ATCC 19364 / DSM 1382 / NCIMB 9332 / VKM B-1759) TaxID=1121448 RepID=T2G6A1_MEGG1|nr:hypothetical protein [Megalodesulfovibrio gigas]AGW12085.1 hypothetical protein DGI_0148 [Megalodesulfovibrio gigas DSM 1382 = ATCC 19364]
MIAIINLITETVVDLLPDGSIVGEHPDFASVDCQAETLEDAQAQAAGLVAQHQAAADRALCLADLTDLAMLTIDPLRAVVLGTATQIDRDRLESLEAVAKAVRKEMYHFVAS